MDENLNGKNQINGNEKVKIPRSHKIVYIAIICAPLAYLIVLIILQFLSTSRNEDVLFLQNDFFLIVGFFLFCSVCCIILTYKHFIPLARRIENPKDRYGYNLMILSLGGTVFTVFGLTLGILWFLDTGIVPFYIVLPIFGFSLFHGYYLYCKYIIKEK